jgi:hypothetical protein
MLIEIFPNLHRNLLFHSAVEARSGYNQLDQPAEQSTIEKF